MKLSIRVLLAATLLAAAACAAPTTPSISAPDGGISRDGAPSDTTSRGPNLFGSGN